MSSYSEQHDFKKVLVVDDITYVIKSISTILRSQNFFVMTAKNGAEAIKKFKKYNPDLVTIDQNLPDMSGKKLASEIKALPGGDTVKIIFISAIHNKQEIRGILDLGVDNYILKPFRKQTLIDIVKKLF
jgi:DNA-binding response OmpR family regulator